MAPPKVLRISLPGTFGSPLASCACLLNQLFALPKFDRLYSNASPWKLLVPDLVTSETCAPEERPPLGIAVDGGDAELVGGVDGGAEDAGEGISLGLVVIIQTIERDVALVGARARDSTGAAVGIFADAAAKVEHARLQAKQVRHVSALGGQGLEGLIVESGAEAGIGLVQRLGFGTDVDGLRCLNDTQLKVDRGGLIDEQLRLLGGGREALRLDGDEIRARRELWEDEQARLIRRACGHRVIGCIGQRDLGIGDERTEPDP